MPLPSRDELRERLAATLERSRVAAARAGLRARGAALGVREATRRRPTFGRGLGIGTAVVMFVGVVVAVVASQNSGRPPGGGGQLLVPVISSPQRPTERSATATVGAPPQPGAPPNPGAPTDAAEHPPPTAAEAPAPASRPAPAAAPTPGATASAPAPEAARTAPPAPGTAEAAPPTASGARVHVVRPGETLAEIALRSDVPFEQIAADSGVADPNRIRPGQRLVIGAKPADVEVVQPGRTLSDYARSSGRRLDELMRLNPRISDPNRILAGGGLRV